ncbi:hypothetical protein [Kitasatospora sp. NPDC059327]|uniref:hypothetical protein n=1 Tax=Kitasatospora sp. NPDC059327 TaxID=3346803 RepID=UPI003687F65C
MRSPARHGRQAKNPPGSLQLPRPPRRPVPACGVDHKDCPITTTLGTAGFDVDALDPVTAQDESAHERLSHDLDMLTLLAVQHHVNPHTELLTDSYFLVHDGTMTWDIPGSAQYAAVHVQRDLGAGSYRFDSSRHAIAALAQNWLADRGADPALIVPAVEGQLEGDAETRELEEFLARSGARFEVVDDYTYDQPAFYKTWIIARDTAPEPGRLPVRVLLEEVDLEAGCYTLRQGGFATVDAAQTWVERVGEPDNPLPPLTAAPSARAAGAVAQSSVAVTLSAPASAPAPATAEGHPARPQHR